ncbi:MAG: endo-1,4-beta-xylanase [Oscillospiraceae bacterium]
MKSKKTLALISALTLISTTIPVNMSMSVNAETVQIFNDTFEDGYDNWSVRGDGSIEVSTEYSHSGNSSLYISGRQKGWHGAGCSKIKELRAGKTYSFSSYVMYQEGNDYEQINMAILYKDATGTEQYKQISNANAKKGEWTQISGNYTIPSDATNVTIYFETPSNLIDFYIDDITAEGEPNIDDDVTYGYNDDFENGNDGWGSRGSETVERVSTEAHSGTYSMYTSNRKQLWNAPGANKTLQLEENGYYKFGIWVKYNDEGNNWADTHKFQLYIQYTADGKDNYVELGNAIATKGEWTYIEAKYTIPEGANNFVIYAQTGYVPDASVTDEDLMNFYIDDATCEPLEYPKIQEDIPSLNDVYSDYFKIGFATTPAELRNEAVQNIMKKHADYMTIGNELKPDSVLDQAMSQKYGDNVNPQISLKKADSALKFAEENGISVRGHVLVWHSQTPDWFFKENFSNDGDWVSKEVMTQRLENYIKNVMDTIAEEYPNVDFYAWDVVNEAYKDTGGMRDAGSNNVVNGQSAWVQVFGDDSFIDLAFEFARKYAPEGCKLFYNDYNEYIPTKRDDICEKVAELKEKGLIDGVGMQSHIKMGSPSIALYEEAIRKYANLGVEVQITELDIDQKSNSASDLSELAERYQEVFKMYKKVKDDGVNLSAVTIWGINDGNSWIGGYPLLFDDDFQAKQCFYAIADTNSQIQSTRNVNAIQDISNNPDGTFELEASSIVDDNSFKVLWFGGNIAVQITSAKDQDVTVYCNGSIKSKNLTAGETTAITFSLEDLGLTESLKVGDTLNFDIAFGDTAWNDLSYNTKTGFTNLGTITLCERPRYTSALYGTPTIDGEVDDVWSTATSIETDNYTMGNGATAKVKTLWDKDYIYVLAEVTDPKLSKSNANVYEQDTVEIFFDENNNKTSAYQGDDIQCRVNFDNEKSVTDGLSTDNFISATSITDTGYIVEFAIPSTLGGFTNNQVVGFDAQVNDDDGSGSRTSIANWSDLTGLGYTNTSNYGVLKLVGGTDEPIETTTTSTIEPTGTITSNPDELLLGDANCDGQVKSNDLLAIRRHLLHLEDLTGQALKNADANKDGDIRSNDILQIRRYLLHLVSEL